MTALDLPNSKYYDGHVLAYKVWERRVCTHNNDDHLSSDRINIVPAPQP